MQKSLTEFYYAKSGSTVLLKIFFWVTVVLLILSVTTVILLQTATAIDCIDLLLTIVAAYALFGLAYSKPLITVVFWRYFLYFGMIETILYSIVLPATGFSRYDKPFVFGAIYVFEILYAIILLYCIHRYAYRKPTIWMENFD